MECYTVFDNEAPYWIIKSGALPGLSCLAWRGVEGRNSIWGSQTYSCCVERYLVLTLSALVANFPGPDPLLKCVGGEGGCKCLKCIAKEAKPGQGLV